MQFNAHRWLQAMKHHSFRWPIWQNYCVHRASDCIQSQSGRDPLFASRNVQSESIVGQCVMNEKGCPEDFLYEGTFSQAKMPRSLLLKKRRIPPVILMMLFSIPVIRPQSYQSAPNITLPGSQSPFTATDP